jgi:hypothetical protein
MARVSTWKLTYLCLDTLAHSQCGVDLRISREIYMVIQMVAVWRDRLDTEAQLRLRQMSEYCAYA